MVSRKSFLSPIHFSLSRALLDILSFFVIRPRYVRLSDRFSLFLLVAAAKQDDDPIAVLAKIDAIALRRVDFSGAPRFEEA
jgi:hypothetical protein